VQDDWKVTPKLTLNLGLRYEFFTPIYEANNQQANYNPTTQSIVVASSSDRYTVNPNTTDFGPRVGASYALNQKTVVRGGFGIGYTHWNRVGSNYLTMSRVRHRGSAPGLSQLFHLHQHPERFPANMVSTSNFNPLEDVLQYMPRSSPDTQVWNWLFSVQRDLGRNWMLDLAYVGNHGLNEIIVNDINQAAMAEPLRCRRAWPIPTSAPSPAFFPGPPRITTACRPRSRSAFHRVSTS